MMMKKEAMMETITKRKKTNGDTEVELMDGENECPVLNIFELLQNPTFVEDDDV